MRVLHLPTSTGGNSYGLATAEKKIGIDSAVLYKAKDYFDYPNADTLINNNCSRPLYAAKLIWYTLQICRRYDVYHFNFGSSILDFPQYGLHLLDLPLYRKKRIVVTYNGSDARQKYKWLKRNRDGDLYYAESPNNKGITAEDKRRRIEKFQKAGASFIALNPDLIKFLPNNAYFFPYTIANWDSLSAIHNHITKTIRIVHAPTNRFVKGSNTVINVMNRIKKKHPGKIDFILVEKKDNAEALRIYRTAHLIIDQLRLGWYGALAVEAMKMGIPVIAYINRDDLNCLPAGMSSDVMDAFPEINEFTLESYIYYLLDNISELESLRERQQAYVWKWHEPICIAKRAREIYEG